MIRLVRDSDNSDDRANSGTYGRIIAGDISLHSMERPWIPSSEWPSGKPMESCFPVGTYDLVKEYSPKYGKSMYYVVNPDHGVYLRKEDRFHDWERWGCMIHPANWVHQINGCVAPGMSRGVIGDSYGVGSSRSAVEKLYEHIDKAESPRLSVEWS